MKTQESGVIGAVGKLNRINLFSFAPPHMRAFHVTWFAFFLSFFSWFAIAPLMPLVRDDLGLTKEQIGNTVIASVAVTIVARLLVGWLCDRIGSRITYTGLLLIGAIPVLGIGLANSYEIFMLFRLAIGVIGASFVITQYHTSVMFGPRVVGTANATTAGWGNLGGGVTQIAMPLILAGVLMFGVSETFGWRLAMVVPGVTLIIAAIGYYFLTQDAPEGNYRELRMAGALAPSVKMGEAFKLALKDYRVWILFGAYAACFGIELTINNIAALYFHDKFTLSVTTAGAIASLFGLMNIFARSLGGIFGDIFGNRFGLQGRVLFLAAVLLAEGLALVLFSRMDALFFAIGSLIVFSTFVQMAEGATYSVVPFVNRRALGAIAGIVGAGGNAGAVSAGFLFRIETLSTEQGLLWLGLMVAAISLTVPFIRFAAQHEAEQTREAAAVPASAVSPGAFPAPGAAD